KEGEASFALPSRKRLHFLSVVLRLFVSGFTRKGVGLSQNLGHFAPKLNSVLGIGGQMEARLCYVHETQQVTRRVDGSIQGGVDGIETHARAGRGCCLN